MANARVLVRMINSVERVNANDMRVVFDAFVFVTGESQVQQHLIDVNAPFVAGSFKTTMRNGIIQWVADHLGDTVVNIVLPDLVPL